MLENTFVQCLNDEVKLLEYEGNDYSTGSHGCSVEIIRKSTHPAFKYHVYADFRRDEEAAYRFENDMFNLFNFFSESLDYDGNVHLECDHNPRDIIERYLGRPERAYFETKN